MLRRRTSVGSVALGVILAMTLGGLCLGASAQASPKVAPKQAFVGLVNGQSSKATIDVVCPGPVRLGETGHPTSGQTIGVEFPPPSPSTVSAGYTGSRGRSIVVLFVSPVASASSTVVFTQYGTQALPTTLLVPCSGMSPVVFVPRPSSKSAKSSTVTVVYGNLAVMPTSLGSGTSRVPFAKVKVQGIYHIVSTDCYFSAGSCSADFDIIQRHGRLSDPHDKLFYGHVRGDEVVFGEKWPPGVGEDSWSCSGTTTDGGQTIIGTMTDGIGGSGAFVMTRT